VLWIAIAIGIAVVAAISAVTVAPLRFELSAKGQGEFGKLWAIAIGVRVLFITISFAAAQSCDSILQLHLFGTRVFRLSPVGGKPAKEDESKLTFSEIKTMAVRGHDAIERWFGLDNLLLFVIDLRHRVRLERFNGNLSYATPDVAVTGMLAGALFTLAGLLTPFGDFRVEPQWVDVAKASGKFDVAFKVYPGRMALDAVIFVFANIKLRRRPQSQIVPAQP